MFGGVGGENPWAFKKLLVNENDFSKWQGIVFLYRLSKRTNNKAHKARIGSSLLLYSTVFQIQSRYFDSHTRLYF